LRSSQSNGGVLQILEDMLTRGSRRILISAYPGFGKTRLIPNIADVLRRKLNVDKVLIFCRSIAEVEEICRFFKSLQTGLKVSSLVGRERLCPFGASSSNACACLRDRGVCPLSRSRMHGSLSFSVINIEDVVSISRELNVCPYDLALSLALQSNIVVCTVMYLSSRILYENIVRISDGTRFAVIVDEAHALVQGLESSSESSVDLSEILGIDIEPGEHMILRRPKIDIDLLKRKISGESESLLNVLFSDVLYVSRREGRYVLRGLTMSTVLDLIERASATVFLSASLTREFSSRFPLLKKFDKIFITDSPSSIENLKIFIVPDFEFRESFKYTRRCINIVLEIIRRVVPSCPLIGGVMILFSSKRFLNFALSHVEALLQSLDIRYIVYSGDGRSEDVVRDFKHVASEERCVLITYSGSPVCEGVNFVGDELICVLMFGFPFPEFSYWNVWKSSYLFGNLHFLLGFVYTAVSATIQIVGRCMRDLDRRVKHVYLIDRRFLKYRRYFPSWFPKVRVTSLRELSETFADL